MAEERTVDGWPGQFLQQAVLYDNAELLQCLLEGEELANINAVDTCGRTAIYTAVSNNSLLCLQLLLEHGGNANIAAGARFRNMTPLHIAVLDDKIEALKLLLESGANLSLVDESGQTPLALARAISNAAAAMMLEGEQDKRQEYLRHLSSRLCGACAQGNIEEVEQVLVDCGPIKEQVLNHIPDHDLPSLCCACKAGNLDLVNLLLKYKAAPVCQRGTGLSPLHIASEAGHFSIVQRLLEDFPDLAMARSIDHKLPLHFASAQPNKQVLKALLGYAYPDNLLQTFIHSPSGFKYKAGFDVNAQDSLGRMPLHLACQHGTIDNVITLLNYVCCGLDYEDTGSKELDKGPGSQGPFCPLPGSLKRKNPSRDSERTPIGRDNSLHSLHSHSSTLSSDLTPSPEEGPNGLCIMHPVVLNHLSNEGFSPLHYAIQNCHAAIVETLLNHGADASQEAGPKDRKVSPLQLAFEQRELGILQLLLENGVQDKDNSALQGAFMSQDQDVITLLLQFRAVRDHMHSVNKNELWKLARQNSLPGDSSLTSELRAQGGATGDTDTRLRVVASPVAIQWQGLSSLYQVSTDCLAKASLRLNPALRSRETVLALAAITRVDISGNAFRKFPDCLFMLSSLVVLDASRNTIVEIADEEDALSVTFMCPSLEELRLQKNKLMSLPGFLFSFPVLKYLDLSYNKLKELPPEMWSAPSLVTLNLSHNLLGSLPIPSKEGSLPRKMSQAKRMSGVSFVGSYCAGSREQTSAHSSETDINIAVFNDSSDSGEGVGLLSDSSITLNEVIHINKWSSSLKVVDRDPWKSMGGQGGLRQLLLGSNRLTSFPTCIPCLAPLLETLDLSDNPLDSVVPVYDLPPNLTELNLAQCGLKSLQRWRIGPDFANDSNCFAPLKSSTYPQRYTQNSPSSRFSPSLTSRESFSIGVGGPCPHRGHRCLHRLEKLSLAQNKLETIVLTRAPEGHLSSSDTQSIGFGLESAELQQRLLFPSLMELDLSLNLLYTLTQDIGEQTALKILTLSRNKKLKDLPPKLGLLKNLWKLDLEMCPLDGAIPDLMHSSKFPVRDILGFLLSVFEDSTYYMCMNLMLVGCHKIGKTSLLQKLRKEGRAPIKPTHWKDRVSKDEIHHKCQTLSTVGIDINELIFDCGSKGSVSFRTWDFGGQREYYATHQYFLSPRSLYLVMWSIIEGERGVEGLQQWLINIQARAPGAPVIIVGTHLDVLRDKATKRNFPPDFEEAMTDMVKKLFLSNTEPDKCGLPNILDAINISCKTGENVRKLVDMIKSKIFDLHHAKSKIVKLLGQKIPRKYLLLQTVVRDLALDRINEFKDPVLTRSKYMLCVADKMMEKGSTTFRDVEELEQATRFLHENGVLFHWDDYALKDLYFLDPQWLCDQLAKVITVKEINNWANKGVMRISNLEFLFRSTTFQPEDVRQYITSLLAKFEVALQFDEENLILPSLLPLKPDAKHRPDRETKIPLRRPSLNKDLPGHKTPKRYESLNASRKTAAQLESRPFAFRPRVESGPEEIHTGQSVFYTRSPEDLEPPRVQIPSSVSNVLLLAVRPCSNPIFSFCRLYFMTYFPSGFWSRLIVRVLADTWLYAVVRDLFHLPEDLVTRSPEIRGLAEKEPEWRCWQTGLELLHMGSEVMRVREVSLSGMVSAAAAGGHNQLCDYSQCRFKCSVDKEWCYLDSANSSILEISFPTDLLQLVHVSPVGEGDGPSLRKLDSGKTTTIVRGEQATAKLLVKIVEHIDNLLQDWYPELGELRFHQNCEGRYLVTRIIPCPQCLAKEVTYQKAASRENESWFVVNPQTHDLYAPMLVPDEVVASRTSRSGSLDSRRSQTDRNSQEERVLTGRERHQSLSEGQAFIYNRQESREGGGEPIIYSFLVERCMLDMMQGVDTLCPVHGSVSPLHMLDAGGVSHQYFIAPDAVFNDLSHEIRISSSDQVDVGQCLGEGNFGKVYKGILHKLDDPPQDVAVKVLFEPEKGRRGTLPQAFQMQMENACNAYLTARQEVSILEHLSHPNIVPFLGLALRPLSLILGLAPNGALSTVLKMLNQASTHLPLFVTRQVILQVARALSYLHSNSIIYRDLKSENVLVWDLPLSEDDPPDSVVHIKIADYGISRTVLPTGTKGFGGTPAFIAPEILQHAGKGTYTEKVDIFSLGMFIFELVTCRFPFIDSGNPNTLICQGGRPSFTTQEVQRCTTHLLDLLSICWSQDPTDRPSAARVVSIVTSPKFCHLQDILSMGPDVGILCGLSLPPAQTPIDVDAVLSSSVLSDVYNHSRPPQIWFSSCTPNSNGSSLEIFSFSHKGDHVISYKTHPLGTALITAMCSVNNSVWCADSEGLIHIFDIDTLVRTHQMQLPVGMAVTVISLHYVPSQHCVLALASKPASVGDSSLIFMCQMPSLGEVTGELKADIFTVFRCHSSVLVQWGARCELWLGQGSGGVLIWDILTRKSADCRYHTVDKLPSSTCCIFLVCAHLQGEQHSLVWSYNFPGTVVYCWSVETKCIVARLDCSTIYATDDAITIGSPQRLDTPQITALNIVDNFLYIGNTRGRIIVAEAVTAKPLWIFPAHSPCDFFVKCILPILGSQDHSQNEAEERENVGESLTWTSPMPRSPGVVSVGRGYADLMSSQEEGHSDGQSRKTSVAVEGRGRTGLGPASDGYAHHTFLLTWSTKHWEFY